MKRCTPLINKAMKIAYDAHHGQTDKSGVPYLYHPMFLAMQMDTEDEIIAALLHDVIEDTPVTFADLEREGFPQTALDALKLLTHIDGVDYASYIDCIGTNPLAVKVKLADLRHNNDPERNANLPKKEAARFQKKYDEALRQLVERSAEWTELLRKAETGDAVAMFKMGVQYYGGRYAPPDQRKAFELFSRAMEKGLPQDEEYISPDNSELNAARYLVPMLLRDEGGCLSKQTEPFWFEKKPQPGDYKISLYIRDILRYITGRGGVKRNLRKAEDAAQHIVLELSFGDRDHYPAITLRSILQDAVEEEREYGVVELSDW